MVETKLSIGVIALQSSVPYFNFVKTALIANRVFFKTLSRTIYTSFMIKGGGQGVLNAKFTDPRYLWSYASH